MKKLTTILVALLLVATCAFSLASCQALDTVEVINGAIEKTANLTEYEAKMNMNVEMTMTGMTMSVPVTVDLKVKDADKENPTVWLKMATEVLGQKMDVEAYIEGDYAYVVTDGEGYKMNAVDIEDEYDYEDDLKEIIKKLPADLIKDIELNKSEDGSYKVTLNLTEETFKALYNEMIEEMNELALSEVDGEAAIGNGSVSVTVKDGYVTNYDLSYQMSMEVYSITADATVTASVEFVNPGKTVTITPPECYESFEELGW